MKTTLKTLICTALCCAAWSAFAGPPPPKDSINVTAQTSTNGVNPSVQGQHWLYEICVPSGGTLSDTLPVNFQGQDNDGTLGESTTVHLNATGSNLGVTVPGDFVMYDNTAEDKNITLFKGGLADGNYASVVHISASGDFDVSQPDQIHINVTVGGCEAPQVTCWFTDSDYNNLFDCNMQEVTGNSGGTFQIVKNARGKVAATNPGQFYYNMLVPNTTGSDQTVTVDLTSVGLSSQGAQAVHAATFDPFSGFPPETDWLYVNTSGTPCGPTGGCTMTIPAGQVLFVTWHVAFSSVGSPAPSAWNNICGDSNNPSVSATGAVTPVFPSTLTGSCTATASGYLKQ